MDVTRVFGKDFCAKNKDITVSCGLGIVFIALHFANVDAKFATQLFLLVMGFLFTCAIHILARVVKYTYKKAYIVLQLKYRKLSVVDCEFLSVIVEEALNVATPMEAQRVVTGKIAMDASIAEAVIEVSTSVMTELQNRVEFPLVIEPEALPPIAAGALTTIEPKVLELIESETLLVIDSRINPLSLVEPVTESAVESEASIQWVSVEGRSIQPDSVANEAIEEISFVSLDETRAALRAEAYLEVEHAAAYLGLPIEVFNTVAKNRSVLPVKKCGTYYLYQINKLDCCAEKLSSKAWAKNLNRTNQEKIISKHGMLTTDKIAIFLNKSEKTLSNWRDTRENSSNEPYGPDFIKVNTSVFYNMRVLLEWCDSPMADKRKPRSKKLD